MKNKYENRYENGICEQLSLELGGISQFVSIRGESLENPVLLVLHGGISLGMFIFIGTPLLENGEPGAYLTHEYGHTLQSLLLGPLYLFVVGIPSALWAKNYTRKMMDAGVSYFSVFPENWANRLGEKVTGIKVPVNIPRSLMENN